MSSEKKKVRQLLPVVVTGTILASSFGSSAVWASPPSSAERELELVAPDGQQKNVILAAAVGAGVAAAGAGAGWLLTRVYELGRTHGHEDVLLEGRTGNYRAPFTPVDSADTMEFVLD